MKLFDWIKKTIGLEEEEDDDFFLSGLKFGEESETITDVLNSSTMKRENLNVSDYKERERFVRDHCEQMTQSSKDVEEQKAEYQIVMEHLSDIETISALSARELKSLRSKAGRILYIEESEKNYKRPVSKISETQYREMARLERDKTMPGALKKLTDSEERQMKIKRDLNLLEGEKGALAYQRRKEHNRAVNSKTFFVLLLSICLLVIAMLLFMRSTFRMDVRMGVSAVTGILALGLTAVFVSYTGAQTEQVRIEKKLKRAVVLQNKTKLKYVNATNLLDFYYSKYNVNSSYELRYMWEKYLEEKRARNHSEEIAKQLDEARHELLSALRAQHIKDPSVFAFEPGILTGDDEMTELRHSLIIQRQRLKKGMDFNNYNLEQSKREIEQLVKDYPQYAREILAIVSQYE
ncbi:MAG TPA: hypothetical protein DCL38_03030 [Lachnospiraceae bacterium]|nr:hypothetical protein [Lachnospiraceae bacterium]